MMVAEFLIRVVKNLGEVIRHNRKDISVLNVDAVDQSSRRRMGSVNPSQDVVDRWVYLQRP